MTADSEDDNIRERVQRDEVDQQDEFSHSQRTHLQPNKHVHVTTYCNHGWKWDSMRQYAILILPCLAWNHTAASFLRNTIPESRWKRILR